MQSLPRDCAPLEDSDSKNELRRAVESLFNSLYGVYVCVNSLYGVCMCTRCLIYV